MDIYIKPRKKVPLTEVTSVFIKDVCDVVAPKDVTEKVNKIKLLEITSTKRDCYLISVTDIIKAIKSKYPDDCVVNVGETDTFVDYAPKYVKANKLLNLANIFFVCCVLFVGSATAIMSFYSDAQIPEVFKNAYKIIFGSENERPIILEIPYAFGLSFGIIMFFNHFIGKKLTDDPTPIEVQITTYESQVSDSIIDLLDEKQQKENKKDDRK